MPAPPRPVYPYSVVPGGVHTPGELVDAAREDAVVAAHYAVFRPATLTVEVLTADRPAYVSYRVGQSVYWTRRPVLLQSGESLVTDGASAVRVRCGNRVSSVPQQPVAENEPPPGDLERPIPPPRPLTPSPQGLPDILAQLTLTASVGSSGQGGMPAIPGMFAGPGGGAGPLGFPIPGGGSGNPSAARPETPGGLAPPTIYSPLEPAAPPAVPPLPGGIYPLVAPPEPAWATPLPPGNGGFPVLRPEFPPGSPQGPPLPPGPATPFTPLNPPGGGGGTPGGGENPPPAVPPSGPPGTLPPTGKPPDNTPPLVPPVIEVEPVPEPAGIWLVLGGSLLLALGAIARRRRSAARAGRRSEASQR
jgi:hypothetical protein